MSIKTLENLVYSSMSDDVKLPESLSSDLRRCSESLQQVNLLNPEKREDKFEEIMKNNSLLKTRFKKYKLFPGEFEEIISKLRKDIN